MPGAPRQCKSSEVQKLIELTDTVFRTGGGVSMGLEFPLFLAAGNAPNCWVIAEGGTLVAHCGVIFKTLVIGAARVRVGLVGAVCTLPACAGKGLGTALFDAVITHARRCGAGVLLISGGRGLYLRRGARFAGRFRRHTLPHERWRHWQAHDLVWRPYASGDAPHLLALYETESPHFVRTVQTLDRAALAQPCGRITMGAWRGDAMVAYWVYTCGADTLTIEEWRGDVGAVTQCANAFPPHWQSPLTFILPAHEQRLAPVLLRAGTVADATFSGTILVIDGPALLDQLQPYWEQHGLAHLHGLPREQGFVIGDATTSITLTDDRAAAFLWGAPDAPAMPEGWQHCLPLPLCEYGLDYI
ncbi:MAG: GNAT family N-acetyltransferase [bacterium]|nr:GNAT family N-acetyltransferase [bacterium]